MKYLLKLNKHIDVVQDVIDGEYQIVDIDGNQLFYDDLPDYIVEIQHENRIANYSVYFYPLHFEKYKDDYSVWFFYSKPELDEILKDITNEEKVEILSINEI